jgi:peroxiredoxin
VQSVDDWFVSEQPEGVRVLSVLVDVHNENKAASFAETYDLSVDVLADQDGLWLATYGGNGGTDQHSYTVVDSEGRVSWHKEGSTTADKIASQVAKAD